MNFSKKKEEKRIYVNITEKNVHHGLFQKLMYLTNELSWYYKKMKKNAGRRFNT